TERLKIFLGEHGFEVASAKGLGYEQTPEAANEDMLHELGVGAYKLAGKADALVLSCGGLRTLDVIVPLEKSIGVPVVSSTPHGLWHCARMLGVKTKIPGFGVVMAACRANAPRRGSVLAAISRRFGGTLEVTVRGAAPRRR